MKAERAVSYQLRIETKAVKCMSGDYFDHKQPHLLPSATKLTRRSVESWASVTAHKPCSTYKHSQLTTLQGLVRYGSCRVRQSSETVRE
jgi:hypothetical protein